MALELSDKQKEVVYSKSGLFVVKACPGSGKTLTVAARLHRLLAEWRNSHAGIATLSFTNAAWQEVQHYLAHDYSVPVPLGYPHFLGTIDSFINRFIFLPFGHKVMGCTARPELTGPPHDDYEPIGRWLFWQEGECHKNRCQLNDFSYGENGELVHLRALSHFNGCQGNHQSCTSKKKQFNLAGNATQADANYYAMKLLEQNHELAAAIARRFPIIMIDEAQDSSSIQMRILDALIGGGVREVMLVGDPYQAIYEWRQAKPQLFEEKFTEWQSNCVWLEENWRSTQTICDLACRLAARSERITARNREVEACDYPPPIYGYGNDSDLPGLLQAFRQHCVNLGIDGDTISVLTRSSEFINKIIPGTLPKSGLVPWRDGDTLTPQVAHAKYLFDRRDYRGAIKKIEVAAYTHRTDKSTHRHEELKAFVRSEGLGRWRSQLFRLLSELPESTGIISDWLPAANEVLSNSSLLPNCRLQIKNDRQPNIYSAIRFDEVFAAPTAPQETVSPALGTIHSVKGRSLEAVFVALKTKGAIGGNYTNLLGRDLLEEEELRIVYVAVTRARKALAIAVPMESLGRWKEVLLPPKLH